MGRSLLFTIQRGSYGEPAKPGSCRSIPGGVGTGETSDSTADTSLLATISGRHLCHLATWEGNTGRVP
jgi:hypothetical protein